MRHATDLTRIIVAGLFLGALSSVAFSPTVREDVYRAKPLKPAVGARGATGCFLRDFVIPDGAKVWRAIGTIASGTTLAVNGKNVDTGYIDGQGNTSAISADIAPFLREGRNRVTVFGAFPRKEKSNEVLFYFQGRVILENGEVIALDAPDGWKFSPEAPDGWTRPDYDVSRWAAAEAFPEKTRGTELAGFYPAGAREFKGATFYPLVEYDGRILYRNPEASRLWFRSENPVKLEVLVPAGLASAKPSVDWTLRRVQGIEEFDVASGTATTFSRRDGSLIFTLDFGVLPQTVYAFESALKSDGKVVEKRYREPLLVYGRTAQREVPGTFFEEGLDRELETRIDFTDPKSPYPWVDKAGEDEGKPAVARKPLLKTPRIVKNGDMVYRETQDDSVVSFFSYRFAFKCPGDWYVLELDYPNDKPRAIGVSITNPDSDAAARAGAKKVGYLTESGPGVVTGADAPISNKIQTLKWVHRADAGEQTLDIVNLRRGKRAAAVEVRIYHIKGTLPAMKIMTSGQRFFGAHEERPIHLGLNFGVDYPGQYEFYYDKKKVDFIGRYLYRLAWYADVANHYAQYLRFSGQNFHVFGSYQYNEYNVSYARPNRVKRSSQVPCDIREILLKYFEANDIKSMSLVEFWVNRSLGAKRAVTDAQVAAGADTIMPVLRDGKQMTTMQNFIHPDVEKAYLSMIDDLAMKFSDSPAWLGVYLMPCAHQVGLGPIFCPPPGKPLDVGYEDATIREFEKDTGVKVPGSGPTRFQARYDFLTSPAMRENWLTWRCSRQRDIFVKTRDALRKHRKDLSCAAGLYSLTDQVESWSSGKSYRETFRQYGFDGDLYRGLDGVSFGRYMYTRAMPHHPAAVRDHWTSPEVMAFYPAGPIRLVAAMNGWQELSEILPKDTDWPFLYNHARFLPRKDLDNCKECFTTAMIMSDPNLMLFGFADVGEMVGQEQQTREIARALTSLPAAELPPALNTGIDSDLAIRAGAVDGKYWFYVANPAFWNVTGEVTVRGAGKIFDAASGEEVKTTRVGDALTVPIALGPFGVRTFYADSPNAVVSAWKTVPLDAKDLNKMNGAFQEYLKLLAAPKVVGVMTPDEISRLCGKLADAEADKAEGRYAAAWRALGDGFCRDLIDRRAGFARYAATLDAGPVDKTHSARLTCSAIRKNDAPATVLDDGLDGAFWRDVPFAKLNYMVSTNLNPIGPAITETRVKIAYTDRELLIAGACADNAGGDIKAIAQTGPELYLKHDDLVDVFLKPTATGDEVFQFAVNAKGFRDSQRRAEDFNPHAQKDGAFENDAWRAAAKIGKDRWTFAFAIPFSVFALSSAPKAGTEWRMNIRRRHREFLTVPEQVWAPLTRSYYNWSEYGYLRFNG